MNDTPISNESSAAEHPEDLKALCNCLRQQLNAVLILLLLVSATLSLFFLRQVSEVRKQRDALQLMVNNYQQQTMPVLNDFTAKLREYSKTHPDVVPILTKYGVLQVSNPAAVPAAK